MYPIEFSQCCIAAGGESGNGHHDDDDCLIGKKKHFFCVGNVARMAGIGEGTGPLSVEVPVERVRQFVYQVGVV